MIDELLSLAGDAVTHARRLGADAVHAVAADGRSTEISVREGQIEKVEQAEARDISLKVYVGKSSATISGSVLTTEAIRRLAENAVNMAKLAPPDPHAGVADPEQLANDIPDLDLAADDGGVGRGAGEQRREQQGTRQQHAGATTKRSRADHGTFEDNGPRLGRRPGSVVSSRA